MTSIAERYDRDADAYLTWWAPVLEPAALRVLDEVAEFVDGDGSGLRLLDLGAGTGALSIAAAERWPGLGVVGVDASTGMLQVARREADRRLGRSDAGRLELVAGLADRLPVPDGAIDVVVSSFVLQLVPDGHAPCRDPAGPPPGGIGVRPGSLGRDVRSGQVFNDVLDEMEIAEPDEARRRSGDFRSAAAAGAGPTRRFRDVRPGRQASAATTRRRTWTPGHYAERSTFDLAPGWRPRSREDGRAPDRPPPSSSPGRRPRDTGRRPDR
jgi:SAM-dependent methyltransferase